MSFTNILVDIDALAPLHPALEQAVDLATRAKAQVTIVDVLEQVPASARAYLSNRLEAEIVEHREGRLADAVKPYQKGKTVVRAAVLRGQSDVALIRRVLSGKHDLLVRYHARDTLSRRKGLHATDMQLLRKCPCPVWLVGVGEKERPKRILAAVKPDVQNPEEQSFNRKIVDLAVEMASLENASLRILTCWTTFGLSLLDGRLTRSELKEVVAVARNAARAELDAFVAAINGARVPYTADLIEGEPDLAIPRYAKRHDIDLVVMGTLARTGVSGLLMGNTAEKVLNNLRCSVLALKPDGFVSPVGPNA